MELRTSPCGGSTQVHMVEILLMFTRGQRSADWDLAHHSFKCMLPYFFSFFCQIEYHSNLMFRNLYILLYICQVQCNLNEQTY